MSVGRAADLRLAVQSVLEQVPQMRRNVVTVFRPHAPPAS